MCDISYIFKIKPCMAAYSLESRTDKESHVASCPINAEIVCHVFISPPRGEMNA